MVQPLSVPSNSLRSALKPSSSLVRSSVCPYQRPRNITRPRTQSRQIFDFLPSGPPTKSRHLTHTKSLPYSPSAIFDTISDVKSYPSFLPFTISSTVTSQDARGYPTRATLKVGYEKFGVAEDWDSIVSCKPNTGGNGEGGVVEAKSSKDASGGLFEVLRTKWEIFGRNEGERDTKVKVDVEVKFRNILYDQMFEQVEGRVAGMMIEAFEKRVGEVEKQKQQRSNDGR